MHFKMQSKGPRRDSFSTKSKVPLQSLKEWLCSKGSWAMANKYQRQTARVRTEMTFLLVIFCFKKVLKTKNNFKNVC